jgi:pimeloyl-ACP methyl ester carboxylesterase
MTGVGVVHAKQRALAVVTLALLAVGLVACGSSGPTTTTTAPPTPTTTSTPSTAPAVAGIAAVPVQVIETADGQVGYRQLGTGTPLVLIMGLSGSIDDWAPSFVNALAERYRVVVFDNAGIGRTAPLPAPLTIGAMAEQTSAFISALGLGKVDVLGWSMGGMVAQALAVTHPSQVGRLVLAATQPGTGHALPVPPAGAAAVVSGNAAAVLKVLFPAGQAAAKRQYVAGIVSYPGFYGAPTTIIPAQAAAVVAWLDGTDTSGHLVGSIRVPTLVADGAIDALDPAGNDRQLAADIPGAQLVLYPDASHGFLFQDAAAFVPRIEQFLG